MKTLSLALLIIMALAWYNPKFDYTRDKKLLLWYGRKVRKYIIIMKIQ